jgi:hypothetical protein
LAVFVTLKPCHCFHLGRKILEPVIHGDPPRLHPQQGVGDDRRRSAEAVIDIPAALRLQLRQVLLLDNLRRPQIKEKVE